MKKLLNRIITTLLLAAIPTIFCSVISTPISYAIPLKCPSGSQALGISCIDPSYHNLTPWYRRDIGPSLATLPIWLVLSLGIAWLMTRTPSSAEAALPISEGVETKKPGGWLPTRCPYCDGVLVLARVKWINGAEAKCPHCGSIIKKSRPVPGDKR